MLDNIINSIIIGIITLILMYFIMSLFKNSENRIRSQIVSSSVVLGVMLFLYSNQYYDVLNAIGFIIPMVVAYGISIFLVLRNTNFLRRMKFKSKGIKTNSLLPEKMLSSKVIRKRYIVSIILLYLAAIGILVFTIIEFDILMLITTILAFIFISIYTYQVIKMDVFKKDEPIRKLVIIVKDNRKQEIFSVTSEEKVFNTSSYLDKLREYYFVKPVAKVFLFNGNYEIHNTYLIDVDIFHNEYDFLKIDNYNFYKEVLKEESENFVPFFMVSETDGKTEVKRIK